MVWLVALLLLVLLGLYVPPETFGAIAATDLSDLLDPRKDLPPNTHRGGPAGDPGTDAKPPPLVVQRQ